MAISPSKFITFILTTTHFSDDTVATLYKVEVIYYLFARCLIFHVKEPRVLFTLLYSASCPISLLPCI